MASDLLIRKFAEIPIEHGHATPEQFSAARRLLVEACLTYFEDLRKAAKPEAVADAKAEQEASLKAYLSLPRKILDLPENYDRPFPLNTTKSAELRQAFQRIDLAKRAAYYSERGQKFAAI